MSKKKNFIYKGADRINVTPELQEEIIKIWEYITSKGVFNLSQDIINRQLNGLKQAKENHAGVSKSEVASNYIDGFGGVPLNSLYLSIKNNNSYYIRFPNNLDSLIFQNSKSNSFIKSFNAVLGSYYSFNKDSYKTIRTFYALARFISDEENVSSDVTFQSFISDDKTIDYDFVNFVEYSSSAHDELFSSLKPVTEFYVKCKKALRDEMNAFTLTEMIELLEYTSTMSNYSNASFTNAFKRMKDEDEVISVKSLSGLFAKIIGNSFVHDEQAGLYLTVNFHGFNPFHIAHNELSENSHTLNRIAKFMEPVSHEMKLIDALSMLYMLQYPRSIARTGDKAKIQEMILEAFEKYEDITVVKFFTTVLLDTDTALPSFTEYMKYIKEDDSTTMSDPDWILAIINGADAKKHRGFSRELLELRNMRSALKNDKEI